MAWSLLNPRMVHRIFTQYISKGCQLSTLYAFSMVARHETEKTTILGGGSQSTITIGQFIGLPFVCESIWYIFLNFYQVQPVLLNEKGLIFGLLDLKGSKDGFMVR